MNYNEYIEINPDKRFGRPVVIGTQISVNDVVGWLAEGMSVDDIIADFPELNEEQIQACLSYGSDQDVPKNHDLLRTMNHQPSTMN
jgi:uncharacterized protein (DUF433 family)